MTIQTISIGTVANDGTGDTLRNAYDKVNDNFTDASHAASKLVGPSAGQVPTVDDLPDVNFPSLKLNGVSRASWGEPVYSGTVTGGASNTLSDTAAKWLTANVLADMRVVLHKSASADQAATVLSNTTGGTLTIDGTWASNPVAGDTYEIYALANQTLSQVVTKEGAEGSVSHITQAVLTALNLRSANRARESLGPRPLIYNLDSNNTWLDRYGTLQSATYYSGTPTSATATSFTHTGAGFTAGAFAGDDAYIAVLSDGSSTAYRWIDANSTTAVYWQKPIAFTATSYKIVKVRFEEGGVLVEGATTNQFTYSEAMSTAFTTKSGITVTSDAVVAPDGTTTADTLTETTATSGHYVERSITLAANQRLTYSIYIKANGRDEIWVTLYSNSYADYIHGKFVLSTLSATTASGGAGVVVAASIEPIGNGGWYRILVSGVPTTAVVTDLKPRLTFINGSTTYTGDGSSGVHVTGADIETLAVASSYMKTTASTAARSATNPYIARAENLPNLGEDFSFRATARTLGYVADNTLLAIGTDLVVKLNASMQVVVVYNGTTITGATALSANTEYGIGVNLSGTTLSILLDGVSDGSDTVTPADSTETNISIGHNAGSAHWWGNIAALEFGPARTAAEWLLAA